MENRETNPVGSTSEPALAGRGGDALALLLL